MTTRQPWDHKRKSPSQRGYGAEHKRLRALLLAKEPLCRECAKNGRVTAATIADHIVPLSKGGKTELSNYQPLCREHSDAKTLRDQGKRVRPRTGPDGWPVE